jgi:hypothetical protein
MRRWVSRVLKITNVVTTKACASACEENPVFIISFHVTPAFTASTCETSLLVSAALIGQRRTATDQPATTFVWRKLDARSWRREGPHYHRVREANKQHSSFLLAVEWG